MAKKTTAQLWEGWQNLPTRPATADEVQRYNQANPPVGPPPPDPTYEAYAASAQRNLALGQGEATYQLGQLGQEYGITDHSNPYSRAALLEESYKRSKLGTTNSYANAGQLYSGAYGRMQGENQRNYSIGSDALQRQYANAVHGVQYGQAQNAANYGVGMDDAAYQALLRALGLGT